MRRLGQRHDREAGRVEQRHHALDVGALRRGQDDRRRVGEPERVRTRRDHLHGVRRPAALVDREVDALGGVDSRAPCRSRTARAGRPGTS